MNEQPQITEHFNSNTLNALIDGEFSPTERQVAEQHLTTCHACTLRVLSATQLKAATARAGRRFVPPPEALGRLAAHLRSQSQLQTNPHTQTNPQPQTKTPARLYSIRPAAWAALAAAILLTISPP
jgi:anti-sigma factor RsiW